MKNLNNIPKVSVIIPCYNINKYLPNCFKSLQNQTYENLEIIFINDGSVDNTLQTIKNFCAKKEGFICKNVELKFIDKKNGGISSARNEGLKIATGDYAYFYDPDDILHPNIINTLISLLKENNAQMAVCDFKKVPDGIDYDNYKFSDKTGKLKTYDKIEAIETFLAQKDFDFCVWNKIYDMKILKDNGIFYIENCRYGEDTNFNYLYMQHIDKLVYTNQKLYLYLQRKNSQVHEAFNEKRLEAFLCLNSNILDSQKNLPEVLRYTYGIRTLVCCEMIYFIFKSKYNNVAVINKLLEYFRVGIPFLKQCKKITFFRRTFIPLIPFLAKILLKKRMKKGDKISSLPACMQTL